ncbi:exopolysaccharide biosynthesis protein [Pseudoalteromonas luteoviolacea]|uniref:Exopolysaccharide biosynthesis protein n=1 Tax=Pseudoalteromonas luteoviolacea TaxID=43657 RepID=A0A1C0TNE0_9GAMM|nr:exopolysaccharide biosynthesis polyprenyl glycosylphosphotransferase [Pseudoalteromonas luteoviolacea]OCQ20196.1 exopolysaccharide biosynthesis protein [Pseudoalteromonas luteoviolacea]
MLHKSENQTYISNFGKPAKSGRSKLRSRKRSLQVRKIYLFCPEQHVEAMQNLAEQFDFEFIINDYSETNLSNQVICHYESAQLPNDKRHFLIRATEMGAWVEPLVTYLDARYGYTEVSLLHSSYFLHQKAFSILSNKRTQVAKRIIDIFSALIIGLLTLPISLLTALFIKLESKGPVFYKQLRTGQHNEEFYIIKFRSMYQDAERDGAQWAKKNDSRVTIVGKFIRKTRIDEIPQLLNILYGEMSMVGPRPEREVFIDKLEKEIPYYRFRHAVKPGVTGLAQVSYPYGDSIKDAIWKHKFDIHYIKHHSTLTDLKIILKTIKVVLFGMGR